MAEREQYFTRQNQVKHFAAEGLTRLYVDPIPVYGTESLDETRCLLEEKVPVVMPFNHLSNSDFPVLYSGLERSGYGDIAKKLVPFLGIKLKKRLDTRWMIDAYAHIVIWPPSLEAKTEKEKEEKRITNMRASRLYIRALKGGLIPAISMEATRSRSQALEQAYPDIAGYLQLMRNIHIQTVAISETDKRLPIGKFFPSPGIARLSFGKPFGISDVISGCELIGKDGRQERNKLIMDTIMYKIADLLPENYRGYYAGSR